MGHTLQVLFLFPYPCVRTSGDRGGGGSSTLLRAGLLLLGLLSTPGQLLAAVAPRPLWTNATLVGSPEPPSPYVVERVYPQIAWRSPIYLADEPGSDQLWVVLQGGEKDRPSRVVRLKNDLQTQQTEEVLQLGRQLIYGLTFHPGFSSNRFVFVFNNGPTGEKFRTNRVSRFTVSSGEKPVCDPNSEVVILEWFSAGHDGGDLGFGRDGMLYITSGDGSSDSDAYDSGQDVSNLLATLIRIDVDRPAIGKTYSVPQDNPFVKDPRFRPEIWAYGFRNPWRMCVDPRTGEIWVGNNGQDLWETAYLVRKGHNYGWSVMEGSHAFYPNRRRGPTPITLPIIEHPHSEFRSLTGGVVYYGQPLRELDGTYVYGDYSTGKIWGARHREGQLSWQQELADTTLQFVGFRVDQRGNLLVVDLGGGIYRLIRRPPGPPRPTFPKRLSEAGLFASVKEHRVFPGLIPYAVNAPGWTDGAQAERYIGLPGNAQIQYASTRGWNFTNGSVLVQTLTLPMGGTGAPLRRIETRVMVRDDNEWLGYSYLWNEEQTEAWLVEKEGKTLTLPSLGSGATTHARSWRVPSRAECLSCHARAVNYVLGLSEVQMNRTFDHGQGPVNQLTRLTEWGVLRDPPQKEVAALDRLVDPYDETQDLERRARSYLHANCSVCHVEAGGGNAKMELEINRGLDRMQIIGARPQHDSFGLANAMIISPGEPTRSVLLHRLARRGRGQMPPLMTLQVDERAVALFRQWIGAMKTSQRWVKDWRVADLGDEVAAVEHGKWGEFAAGRLAFQKVGCAQCHRLAGEGGSVGPDLTGAGRRLGTRGLLESIVEPSKTIAEGFASYEWETKDGETITGQLDREEPDAWVIRSPASAEGMVRVPKSQVVNRRTSTVSNMPAGILNSLEKAEILDLLTYLWRDGRPPASGTAE